MESLFSHHILTIINRICNVIEDQEIYLSELDGVIGDGDHGISMVKAFGAVKLKLADWNEMDCHEILENTGLTVMNSAGGTTGPLFGIFFLKMGKRIKGKSEINLDDFVLMMQDAEKGIRDIGHAKEGDKSLLDTLAPAIRALESAATDGHSFSEALVLMDEAANEGWLATKDMVSKIGRSHRLGERTLGHLDAGATSMYLILREISRVFIIPDAVNSFLES